MIVLFRHANYCEASCPLRLLLQSHATTPRVKILTIAVTVASGFWNKNN